MTPDALYKLTPGELFKLYDGYQEREKKDIQKLIITVNAKFLNSPLKIEAFYPAGKGPAGEAGKTAAAQKIELENLKKEVLKNGP